MSWIGERCREQMHHLRRCSEEGRLLRRWREEEEEGVAEGVGGGGIRLGFRLGRS